MHVAGKFFRNVVFAVVAVSILLFASLAAAADRWIVVHAEGDGADAIAKELKAHLPKGLTAVDSKQFDAALAKAGHKGAMGKALDSSKTRDKLLEKVRKAADAAKLDAVVIVRVKKEKKGRKATVLVVDPKTAALAREDEVDLPAKKGKDDAKPVLASALPAIEKFAPAPEPEKKQPEKKDDKENKGDAKDKEEKGDKDEEKEEKAEEEKKDEAPSEERPEGDYSRALVIVGAGVDVGIRRFEYNQPITRNLRAYNVAGAPMLALSLELYPLATQGGPLGDIGLVGSYARALALQSAPAGGEKISTAWDRFSIGLRYRLRLGAKGPMLMPTVSYGGESFTFANAGRLESEVPAATYSFVRAALDSRIPVGPIGVMAGVGWLFTSAKNSDLTTVAGRFPRAKVGGVDAHLGAGISIVKGLEARLLFRYTRFFYSMNPEPGDPYVAGGAVDHFASVHIGAAYAY